MATKSMWRWLSVMGAAVFALAIAVIRMRPQGILGDRDGA